MCVEMPPLAEAGRLVAHLAMTCAWLSGDAVPAQNQFNIPEVVPYCHEYSSGPCKPSLGGLSGSIAADAGLVIR